MVDGAGMTGSEERPYASTACPHCGAPMTPLPKAKSRCRACGQPVWVRSGPDGFRYLLQEADLPVLEAAWTEYHDAREAEHLRELQADGVRYMADALRSYAEAGIAVVEIIGAPDPCPACASAQRIQWYQIGQAPGYPVPGCTSELCRCDYVPVIT